MIICFMKKTLVLLAIFCATFVGAQHVVELHTGINFSNARISGINEQILPSSDFINHVPVGVAYEYAVTKNLSARTELNYLRRGFEIRQNFNIPIGSFDLPVGASAITRINYLEIPLMLKYYFTESNIRPYVYGGPSVSYGLNGTIQERAHLLIDFNVATQNINLDNNNFNRWEAGARAGAGISFKTPIGIVSFEGQYYHSLTDFFDQPIVDIHAHSYQLGFQVGLAYSF